MARISPFHPYRYTPQAGPLEHLVTQPYDKISPAMQQRYLALSPYNLVRIILGERSPSDDETHNVYTRAATHLTDWITTGILARDPQPGIYPYFQRFAVPDTGEVLERKGFIALGAVEDYSTGVVHRHEQTLAGPKKDRLELLRHTRAHAGQIFMLYPDPSLAVDALLDHAAASTPLAAIDDEYGASHRVWRVSDPPAIAEFQRLMSDKKLLIADGHHRYETALAFRNENPALPGADKVMMTFVNMHSPGLKILATHRLVRNLANFDAAAFIASAQARRLASVAELRQLFSEPAPGRIRIGITLSGDVYVYDRARAPGELDVSILHQHLLGDLLGITEEAVRNESHLQYIRGIDDAYEKVRSGAAQIGFLLEPTTVEQVAGTAFSGGVMPQKSTDFYPKLLSGLTIYRVGE
jgi:uncharacterized protein (DUF1015 family)